MSAPPAWVAALPSDDDEEDCYIVEQPRKVVQSKVVIVEDDDVQVVNVMKHDHKRSVPDAEAPPRVPHSNSMDFRGAASRLAATAAAPIQHGQRHQQQQQVAEPSSRKRKRNEVQQQLKPVRTFVNFDERLSGRRVHEEDSYFMQGFLAPHPLPQFDGREQGMPIGNAAAPVLWRRKGVAEPALQLWRQQEISGRGHASMPFVPHEHPFSIPFVPQEHFYNSVAPPRPRDYGILGGGPASQLRERDAIARASSRGSREHGLLVPQQSESILSAPPAFDRWQAPQQYNTHVRFIQQERFETVGAPGNGPIATLCSLERMLTRGNTVDEWWSSLQETLGANFSKLHRNIVSFCQAYEVSPQQMQMRREALEYVERTVREHWPNAEVLLFGSTATGLALPWSDIDIAVMSSCHYDNCKDAKSATVAWMAALSKQLRRYGQVQSLVKIPHAKVPVLKVVFRSGVNCDISFDAHNGPRGVPVVRQFMQQYEALRPLCIVLKFFLGQLSLNELYTGGLGSFCLITMVVSHLQKLGVAGTGHDLGALLLSFFIRYGMTHDYRTDVVSTRAAEFCASKQAKGWVNSKDPELLSVEDPLDPTSDIAKGSYRIQAVRSNFLKAKGVLLAHWHHDNVLGMLVDTTGNPNQRPKAQAEKAIKQPKQPKQKKRKTCNTVGSEMENGQPVKSQVMKHPKKPKQKKGKKGDTAGSEMESGRAMKKRRKQKNPMALAARKARKERKKQQKETRRVAAAKESRAEKSWNNSWHRQSNSGTDTRKPAGR